MIAATTIIITINDKNTKYKITIITIMMIKERKKLIFPSCFTGKTNALLGHRGHRAQAESPEIEGGHRADTERAQSGQPSRAVRLRLGADIERLWSGNSMGMSGHRERT